MSYLNILMISFYWLFLSGTVFITGALVLKILITIPSGADACVQTGKNKTIGECTIPVIFFISLITLIFNIAHVILHCSVITETPLQEVFSVIPLFLLKTKYGMFSVMRTIVMATIVLVLAFALKRNDKLVIITGIALSLMFLVMLTMSGHQGTKGYLSIPFLFDVLHVTAISIWIGGLFSLYCCYSFFLKKAGSESWGIFLELINRFSRIATLCVVTVIVSGIVLYIYNFKGFSGLVTTDYGIVLLIKILLVVPITLFGAINKFSFIPQLNKTDGNDWTGAMSLRRKLDTTMTIEVFLGLLILLATSILTHLSPGE
jgi:putative copper export protein